MIKENEILAIAGKIPIQIDDMQISFSIEDEDDDFDNDTITATIMAHVSFPTLKNNHPNIPINLSEQRNDFVILNLTPQ